MNAVGRGGSAHAIAAAMNSAGPEKAAMDGAGPALPPPNVALDDSGGDVMAALYKLTSKQRDEQSSAKATAVTNKKAEREASMKQMEEELAKAKEAQEDAGLFAKIGKAIGSASDVLVGGNPLQDLAHSISEATGCDAFDIAYDIVRPDAILHGAAVLASKATGEDAIRQVYDLKPWEKPASPSGFLIGEGSTSSLRTKFQATADLTGREEVMVGYEITRDAMASAMTTVATCGTGTAAMVAITMSSALMLEQRLKLLERVGVSDNVALALRIGGQVYSAVATGACAGVLGTKGATVASRVAISTVNGAQKVGQGSMKIAQAVATHAADVHLADAEAHKNTQKQLDAAQQRIIAALRELSTSYQKSLETLAGAIKERDDTSLDLARRIA